MHIIFTTLASILCILLIFFLHKNYIFIIIIFSDDRSHISASTECRKIFFKSRQIFLHIWFFLNWKPMNFQYIFFSLIFFFSCLILSNHLHSRAMQCVVFFSCERNETWMHVDIQWVMFILKNKIFDVLFWCEKVFLKFLRISRRFNYLGVVQSDVIYEPQRCIPKKI